MHLMKVGLLWAEKAQVKDRRNNLSIFIHKENKAITQNIFFSKKRKKRNETNQIKLHSGFNFNKHMVK